MTITSVTASSARRARRRLAGGGQAHDDHIIRARMAQAFGRLIRTRTDRGHFVVLSAAFPSRLLSAFPAGTPVHRVTLEAALQRVSGGVSARETELHRESRTEKGGHQT